MKKKSTLFLLSSILTLGYVPVFASNPTIIETGSNTFHFEPGVYESLSEDTIARILDEQNNIETHTNSTDLILEYNGRVYNFVCEEFRNYSKEELIDIVKQPPVDTFAVSTLQSRSLSNDQTGTWGPYVTNSAYMVLMWTPTVNRDALVSFSASNTDFSRSEINMSSSRPVTYVFMNTQAGSHTLSLTNHSAGTITVGGTFEIQQNRP